MMTSVEQFRNKAWRAMNGTANDGDEKMNGYDFSADRGRRLRELLRLMAPARTATAKATRSRSATPTAR